MSEPIEPLAAEIPAEEPSSSGKRLTKVQWLEIEDHVAYNTMSGREICKTYGISGKGLSSHFRRLMENGVFIARGCKRHLLAGKIAGAVSTTVAASTAGVVIGAFAAKRKERIEQTKTSLFQQSQINQMLLQKIQRDVAGTPTSPGKNISEFADDIKSILNVERALTTMAKNRWLILDIENDIDEATMPKLIFEDLTEAEIASMQNASGEDEDDDLDIEVTGDDDDGIVEESDDS